MKVTLELGSGQEDAPIVVWHLPEDREAAERYRSKAFPGALLGVVTASTSLRPGQLLVSNAPGG